MESLLLCAREDPGLCFRTLKWHTSQVLFGEKKRRKKRFLLARKYVQGCREKDGGERNMAKKGTGKERDGGQINSLMC